MLYRVMDKGELPKLVRAFMESYEVVAPVKRGRTCVFDRIDSPDEIELGYTQTSSSPKKYFMPPVETMMRFDAEMNLVQDYAEEVIPRGVFGVHTCDINALNRLDIALLGGKYVDPYYKARRDATMVVGLSCTPNANCFCHLWGSDEAQFGYDLFLHDIGEKYLVSMSNVEATNILEASCELAEATEHFDDFAEAEAFATAALDGPAEGIHAFADDDIFSAVYTTNLLMRACDFLVTKPSELAFYPVPKLMIKRVGGHEAWGAIRAAEVGDGTYELETLPEIQAWIDLVQEEPEIIALMCDNIESADCVGTYDGAYRAVQLATLDK